MKVLDKIKCCCNTTIVLPSLDYSLKAVRTKDLLVFLILVTKTYSQFTLMNFRPYFPSDEMGTLLSLPFDTEIWFSILKRTKDFLYITVCNGLCLMMKIICMLLSRIQIRVFFFNHLKQKTELWKQSYISWTHCK